MPLFPSRVRNPDLSIAFSYCGFRTIWTQWFEGLGALSMAFCLEPQ